MTRVPSSILPRLLASLGCAASLWAGSLAHAQAREPVAAAAADAKAPLPAAMLMPWRLIHIDAELATRSRRSLQAGFQALTSAWLDQAALLSDRLPNGTALTANAKRIFTQVMTGTPQNSPEGRPLALEASWCQLLDRDVLFLTLADARSNLLLASDHFSMARKDWQRGVDDRSLDENLRTRLPQLLTSVLNKARTTVATPPRDALHIGLALGQTITRRDEGESSCLHLLLEEQLAAKHQVARALGGDHLASVRDVWQLEPALLRPTRTAVLRWQNLPGRAPLRSVPHSLSLRWTAAETILGQTLPDVQERTSVPLALAADGSRINLTPPAALLRFFEEEAQSLALDAPPTVLKVDRAWVYLSQGRAVGLRVGDRLIANTPDGPVKAHIVRYYGPSSGIVGANGRPIREGAIAYVRKNQRLAKVGLVFTPDPKTFPTPWPPTPSGN